MRRWHLLTGEYAPDPGGIARFTTTLAGLLAAAGQDVHVWTPTGSDTRAGVVLHRLQRGFDSAGRRELARAIGPDDIVLLQYTPNALGARGANLVFCLWLARLGRRREVRVVFHEPFMYFAKQSMARNGLALIHRGMAAVLLAASRTVYLSSESWRRLLQPYAFGRAIDWQTLPISIGDLPRPSLREVTAMRARLGEKPGRPIVGHFGTYAGELAPFLAAAIDALLQEIGQVQVVCIGRGSRDFVASRFPYEPRVQGTGEIPEAEIAPHLSACDLLIAPFGEGVTTRRTSLIAALALGRPVVATDGRHTEPQWRQDGAVVVVPAGHALAMAQACKRLLADTAARERLGARAASIAAQRFSPGALLAVLGLNAVSPMRTPGEPSATTGVEAVRE